MKHNDYPALYVAADSASNNAQKKFLLAVRVHTGLLIIGAALAVNPLPSWIYSITNAMAFIGAIGISILLSTKNYEKTWYSARALAESVKTASWRFMMQAEPFHDLDSAKEAKSEFSNQLKEILHANNQLGEVLGDPSSDGDQITQAMITARSDNLEDRKSVYLKDRIDEQRLWYFNKSKHNQNRASQFFVTLIVLQFLAVVCVLLRIAFPAWAYWPTDIFVVAAGGVMTWVHLKRYREVTAAYSLTAH
ncbi:MAG: hypothetical protein Tsb002_23610 [Wenzhouxiangellaceae bacterium]